MASAPLSRWSKAEATQYLQKLGEPAHPSWTAPELKSRIGELRAAQLVKLNVTMSSSYEVIAKECMTNGIVLVGTENKAHMLRKLRRVAEERMVVAFGITRGGPSAR